MKQGITLSLLAVTGLWLGASACRAEDTSMKDQKKHGRQTAEHLKRQVTMELDYLLYLPPDYAGKDSWPLMVFLHGAGERGHDLNLVKKHGPPKLVEAGKDFPFIIVSPQCPTDQWWPGLEKEVMALVDEIVEKYNVDESRIYLTGLSMGGYGTWTIGCSHPDRFAAMVPLCGGGRPFRAASLKDMPIWAFHGEADPVVPVAESRQMVEAVNKAGGHAKLTTYPGVGHDCWTQTYENPRLYEWILSQHKAQD